MTSGGVEKSQILAMGKYLTTMFLLSPDRLQYGELILSLKNDYAKQQRNYPRTLTDMYRLMVVFEPTRETLVAGGRKRRSEFWERGRRLWSHREQGSCWSRRHREETGVLALWREAP